MVCHLIHVDVCHTSIIFFKYLRVSSPLAGLILGPHTRTHTDGGWLTLGGIDAGTSVEQTQCPNHRANTPVGCLSYQYLIRVFYDGEVLFSNGYAIP